MKYLVSIMIFLVAAVICVIVFIGSGIYNIAATEPHWGITTASIEMFRGRSVAAHSRDIQIPDLDRAAMRQDAFPHYHEMCRLCHGAPGYGKTEFAQGLYPEPPELTSGHFQDELSDPQIYWIVKNGLKMTGMPAFGPTHSEKELWGLTVLARSIPRMNTEDYRRQVENMYDSDASSSNGAANETEETDDHEHSHD